MRSKLWALGPAAVILTVAAILATIWSNGTNNSAACTPYIHAPVPTAAKKALASYSGRIMHDVEHSADGTRDVWWDDPVTGSRRQLAFDRSGRLESEFVNTTSGNVERSYWVLYPAHNVLITSHRVPVQMRQNNSGAAEIAQLNRDMVANGRATIVGREEIDGRQALHLRQTIHPAAPPPLSLPKGFHIPAMPAFNVDTWVDPLTYLTVRTRVGEHGGSSFRDETWLPRTPANIAKTKLVIPPGFTRVVPNHSSGFDFSSGSVTLKSSSCQS